MTVLLAVDTQTVAAKTSKKVPAKTAVSFSKSQTPSLHVENVRKVQQLSEQHRSEIVKIVNDAKLAEEFWTYFRSGQGRLSVAADDWHVKITVSRPRSEVSATLSNSQSLKPSEINTLDQFLIFLNALRFFSFFQLASQLEAIVLPDRCIRVSPSGSKKFTFHLN